MELRKRKRNPKEEAAYFSSACKDKDEFDVKYINPDKDDSLGRLVNDDHVRPNSKMKTITVAGKPHLCLFATRSISPGEEITYNYGDSEWPWRCKNIAETDALVSANSVLAENDQMQPEEQLPQVPRDTTHKVPEEGPFASPMMATLPPVKQLAQNKSEADVPVTTTALLTEKDQMQSEELHPLFSREATHKNIAETNALVSANSVLAENDQMQPEEQLPQVPRDTTHKVPEEGPFASPMMATLPPVKQLAQNKSEANVPVTTTALLTEKDQMQPEELHPQFSREATHKNIAETNALVSANSVLAENDQMQPEEQLPQVPRDTTHKVPEEGPFASPMMATLPPVKQLAQNKSEANVPVTTTALLTEKDQMQPEELHPQFSREATHKNIAETNALVSANSVLAENDQMQPEEQLPQVPRDTTHKVPEEGPFASPMMATLPPVKQLAQNKSEANVPVTTTALLTEKDQMQPEELHPLFSREATHENCKHELVLATVSSMNKCIACVGPVASLKWIGLRCNVCSCFWHKSCFEKLKKHGRDWVLWGERNSSSDEDKSLSDEEYVPESESDSESDSSLDLAIGYKNKAKVSEQKLKAVHSKFTKSCSSKLPLKHASKGNGKQCLKAREGTCLNEEADLFCYEEQLTDVESDVESDSSREWEDAPLREVQVKLVSDIKLSSEVAALGSRRNDFCLTRSVTVTPTKEELLEVRGSANEPDFQDVPLTGQEDTMAAAENCLQSSVISCSENKKNYCYICGKPQSKFSRHLKTHMNDIEVSEALSFPKYSKERKRLLEKIRNKGNYQHNSEVLQKGIGLLKLKRRPNRTCDSKQFVHCLYCKGMFVRKDLWRHVRRCSAKPGGLNKQQGRTKVLGLAALAESTLSQQISQGVWKLLSAMKQDEIASVVRNDFCILQLAQSFFNKHGNDPTKYEYIRQKLREIGRFLMILRSDSSIYSIEETIKPANFSKVIQAVKKVSGYDEEKNCYQTPSLALKLGHTLQKVCEIIHCRALMAEDEELIKSTETFKKLYTTKWSEMISHTALNTLNEAKFNKPSTLPFTHDVQLLHKHLETTADAASENLKKAPSPQSYAKLAKTTLARIIVFNRRRAGEVSKMQLKSFQERDKTLLHEDVAVGLSTFEQKLCSHFCRVEIKGKRGRKVAVLLTPDMVDALTLLVSKRKACGVQDANCFLFARPSCQSYYRGQDCLRFYAMHCGAQNPEHLRSTHLRKHVATLSQILNLKNNELDQVADFLGHDIRVHREYYRLPEATTQLAKISKLLLAMEKGCLPDLQGKSLDEIEIEDEINTTDDSDGSEPENAAMDDAMSVPRQTVCSDSIAAEIKNPRKKTRTQWSKQEVKAVMKHFKPHITKGKLATMAECQQCKDAEDPVLAGRTLQNIRDFVRNRGITFKKNSV
ncbi:hypothetical protein MHYP_G00206880 [Metynnis hypsauchen]